MNLNYPLGLLALLIVPILILIYVIKNKYTEQTVASTYIWTLSEKFLKHRTPINKLVGIISLLLQILTAIVLSFALAHPTFVLKDAALDYCIVIDASGSMTALEDGESRFEIAKGRAREIIKDAVSGSSYTLVCAGDTANVIFENVTDKNTALLLLSELSEGYSPDDFVSAMGVAQTYFNANTAQKTYLITDAEFPSTDNVQVIKIGSQKDNIALSDVEYSFTTDGLMVRGNAISYLSDAERSIELYFDGEEKPYAKQQISLNAGNKTAFEFECEKDDFSNFRVRIDGNDSQPLDDEAVVYTLEYESSAKTVIISDSPSIFLKAALLSAGIANVETVSSTDFADKRGYGLYIFYGVLPKTLPDDGAVWFIDPRGSVEGANFTYQGSAEAAQTATYSTSSTTAVAKLLDGVTRRDFELKQYAKCGLGSKFTTLLKCENSPLVFTGTNVYGNREAVLAFDLRDAAAFTLSDSFVTLVGNLLKYSFPSPVDMATFECGDTVDINIIPGARNVTITTPKGQKVNIGIIGETSEYKIEEVGTYLVEIAIKDKPTRTAHFVSTFPEAERGELAQGVFDVSGDATASTRDGFFDSALILLIILLVLVAADFGVYCYEQYHLR